MKNLPDNETLYDLFTYCPALGNFYWRNNTGRVKAGDVAGSQHTSGYIQISIQGSIYKAHRLAWKYYHGYDPVADIDHINGVRNDNRIANLREATRSNNMCNRKRSHGTKTGIKGISIHPSGLYHAYIKLDGVRINKTFKSLTTAKMWLDAKRIALHSVFANEG